MVPRGTTVNAEYIVGALKTYLRRLRPERLQMVKEGFILHWDNATVHTARIVTIFLATKEQIEMLTKTMRHKLLDFSNKSTEELVIRNAFREFDLNGNGVLTSDELQAMLVRLQISVDRRYIQALLKKFDRNGNGVIEFDEFVNFMVHDPYK